MFARQCPPAYATANSRTAASGGQRRRRTRHRKRWRHEDQERARDSRIPAEEAEMHSTDSGSSCTYLDSSISRRHEFSLDSGVSDGYRRLRSSGYASGLASLERGPRAGGRRGAAGGPASLRTRTPDIHGILLMQQEKIERLAALYERLESACAPPADKRSSSSETSGAPTRQNTRNPKTECKTYDIIARKLDELNRRLASKQAEQCSIPAGKRSSTESRTSESVSVYDKAVSTEPIRVCRSLKKMDQSLSNTYVESRKFGRRNTMSGGGGGDSELLARGSTRRTATRRSLGSAARSVRPVEARSQVNLTWSRGDRADEEVFRAVDGNHTSNDRLHGRGKEVRRPPEESKPSPDLCWLCRALWRKLCSIF